ncbi:hypothetical protein ACS0TY_011268 [Phlomoides rotata]
MDTAAQWPPHQDIVEKGMEEIVSFPKERKVRPQKEQAINCPRCNSTNTKFCYYNNYSLTQPRYFCKTCRRYWTEGGSLRNIPVGGGSRKNKRSSSLSSPSSTKLPDLVPPQNPKTQDLNLGFSIHQMIQVPNFENTSNNTSSSNSSPPQSHHLSPMELLTGFTGLNSFMPPPTSDPNSVYTSSGFPDFKPSLDFSLDALGSNYATFQGVSQSNGKLLFPFQDLKQVSNDAADRQNSDQHGDNNSTGYWNGVIGGGGSW